MRKIIILLGVSSLFGCAGSGWKAGESVTIPDFQVHRGHHCESSAMLNLLRHQGYEITEEQIIGAGAAMGFMLESGKFPFLGGRCNNMKENLSKIAGIRWQNGTKADYGSGWEKICAILSEGTPVVLRVDMRYLPYLYGGKYGPKYTSFGSHYICLAGINAETQTAYVTDTELPELQQIKLKDLEKARFSNTKNFPPEGEFYWTEGAAPDYSLDLEGIAIASLSETEEAMCKTSAPSDMLTGLDGLSKYPEVLASLDERIPSYLLPQVLAFHYGCIETNGTGGSAFRKMYYNFLEQTGRESGNPFIIDAAKMLEPSVGKWTELAIGMQALSEDKQSLKDKQKLKVKLAKLSHTAEDIYKTEKEFYDYIASGGKA